jgi:protein SCO1/2
MAPNPHPDRTARAIRGATVVAVLLAGLVLAGCGGGSDAASSTTESNQIEGIVRPQPLQVGDLSLPEVAKDGTDSPFALRADDGKLLFVTFGYTNCPDVCPTTLYDIKRARTELGADGKDVQVAFASVDPDRDTPEIMSDYVRSFAADGHPLRTEDLEALSTVQDGFGVTSSVVKNPDGTTDVSHTARSFVVDDQGEVVVEWPFGTGPDAMASDLRLLLEQQAQQS